MPPNTVSASAVFTLSYGNHRELSVPNETAISNPNRQLEHGIKEGAGIAGAAQERKRCDLLSLRSGDVGHTLEGRAGGPSRDVVEIGLLDVVEHVDAEHIHERTTRAVHG